MFLNKQNIAKQLNKPLEDIRIGFTCSTFDLFHAGHIVMLQEAKTLCDYLIVGLLIDPTVDRPTEKNKPIQSPFERYIQLSACRYVDEVIPFESEKDLIDLILTINPDIRIVGEEYKNTEHTGVGLCPIHYNSRRHSFSSRELRDRVIKSQLNKENI
jgi:glycerol-3-phosphate cytidylyltransferase